MTKYPPIQLVDEEDNPIGGASMDDIHSKGLLHRAVMVSVRDSAKRMLLQKRSQHVATNPGRWDISAAGHVDEGDTYLEAAQKELYEELGLAGTELKEIAHYKDFVIFDDSKLSRYIKIYQTTVLADIKFKLEEKEVSEARWFTIDELKSDLKINNQSYNKDFSEVLAKILDYENHEH